MWKFAAYCIYSSMRPEQIERHRDAKFIRVLHYIYHGRRF